jgi:hypothetical protein
MSSPDREKLNAALKDVVLVKVGIRDRNNASDGYFKELIMNGDIP